MRVLGVMAGAALMSLAFAAPSNAEIFHNRLVAKVGVMNVAPDEALSSAALPGTDADISSEYTPAINLTYYLTKNVSIDAICCVTTHDVKTTGATAVDLGEVTLFPPTVTAVYHFTNSSPFTPYVGAGVNYTHFFNEEDAGNGLKTEYDDSWGGALQVGVDYALNEKWLVNVDVKKVWIETDWSINNGAIKGSAEINPVIAFVGVGYKF